MFTLSVDPVSQYSKYLVSSACKYESGEEVYSTFCPGYTEVMTTPYTGTKNSKLHAMADVFCSHCSHGDTICRELFCGPDKKIVDITQKLLETFCSAIQIYFPSCYSEYCPASIVKRDAAPVGENINKSVTCKATSDWSDVAGMDQWCEDNCKDGNDNSACSKDYCECTLVNGSESDHVVQSNNLGGTCIEWEASLVWSNVAGMNTWCQNVCSQDASCDPSYCQCKVMRASTSTTTTTLSELSSTSTFTTSSATPSTTVSPVTSSPISTTLSSTAAFSSSASSKASSTTTSFTTSSAMPSTVTFPVTSSPPHYSSSVPSTITSSLKSSISSFSSTSLLTTTTNFPTSTMKSTTTSPSTTTVISGSSQTSQSFPTISGMTSSTHSASINSLSSTSESQSTSISPIVSYSNTFPSSTIVPTTQSSSSFESSVSQTQTSTDTSSSAATSTSSFITSNSSPEPSSSSFSSTLPSSSVVTSTQGTSTPSVSPIIVTSTKPTVNLTDKDSLDIIESIVCDHSASQHHNILSDQHCKHSEESVSQSHSGYNSDILDQVLNFAPRVVCAFMSATKRSSTCPDMFCGDNPLSQEIIRTSICSICEMYTDTLASSCVTTYCQ